MLRLAPAEAKKKIPDIAEICVPRGSAGLVHVRQGKAFRDLSERFRCVVHAETRVLSYTACFS